MYNQPQFTPFPEGRGWKRSSFIVSSLSGPSQFMSPPTHVLDLLQSFLTCHVHDLYFCSDDHFPFPISVSTFRFLRLQLPVSIWISFMEVPCMKFCTMSVSNKRQSPSPHLMNYYGLKKINSNNYMQLRITNFDPAISPPSLKKHRCSMVANLIAISRLEECQFP